MTNYRTQRDAASCLTLAALISIGTATCLAGGDETAPDPAIPGQAMVRLQPGTDISAFLAARFSPPPAVLDAIASRDIYLLATPPAPDHTMISTFLSGFHGCASAAPTTHVIASSAARRFTPTQRFMLAIPVLLVQAT